MRSTIRLHPLLDALSISTMRASRTMTTNLGREADEDDPDSDDDD
jgi:hypothetical protein